MRRDLLGFEETAADQDVGLEDVGGAGGKNVAERILGVEHFSGRDRDPDLAAQGGEGRDVLGPERLLDEQRAVRLTASAISRAL